MTFPRRFTQFGLQSLALALAVAAFVVAPTAAMASTGPTPPPPGNSCAAQWHAAYGTEASGSCVEQALASRGTGAPTQPTAAVADAPRADSPHSGFDWGSAAVGAAVAACLFAAGTLTAMSLGRRGRVRTAS